MNVDDLSACWRVTSEGFRSAVVMMLLRDGVSGATERVVELLEGEG